MYFKVQGYDWRRPPNSLVDIVIEEKKGAPYHNVNYLATDVKIFFCSVSFALSFDQDLD